MGIKKGVTTAFGIDAPEAYHRIKSVQGKNGGNIKYDVDIFYNTSARDGGSLPFESRTHIVTGDLRSKIGIISELYNVLKLESDYAGAEDIYESDPIIAQFGSTITDTFVMKGNIADGYQTNHNETSLSDTSFSADVIIGEYVVDATFTNANLQNIVWDGNTIARCLMTSGLFVMGSAKQMLF